MDDAGNEKDLAVFKPHRWHRCPDGLCHFEGLQELDTAEMRLPPNRLRCHIELFPKRASKGFVRSISRVECDGQDVGGPTRQYARRLCETAAAHVPHDGVPCHITERSSQVVAGYSGDVRDLIEGDLAGEVTFNEPECLADRIHG